MSVAEEPIKLNVGGTIYVTNRSTLTRYPYSKLGQMFGRDSATTPSPTVQGNVFIDRDGSLFRYILNFLRTGQLLLPDNFKEITALAVEVEFFNIPEMTIAIDDWNSRNILKVEERVFEQSGRKYTGTYVDWTILGDPGSLLWLSELGVLGRDNNTISEDGNKLHRSWFNDIRIGVTPAGYQYGFCKPEEPVSKECIFNEIASLGYKLQRKVNFVSAPEINELVKAFVHMNTKKSNTYIFQSCPPKNFSK